MQYLKTLLLTITAFMIACPAFAQTKPTTKTIIDSLEVLKKVGGFIEGHSVPPTAEETRFDNLTRMLFALPFSEARRLLADKNKFARAYGFMVCTKVYLDSLTKADLEIFSDTSSLPLYTQHGIVDAGVTLGQFCNMAYASTIEERKTTAKEPDIKAAVKDFIAANARFPGSYQPIEFSSYSWGGADDQKFYQIVHRYHIKQNDGKTIETTHYFILDDKLGITLIEAKRSNTISADPPVIGEWMRLFGKNQ